MTMHKRVIKKIFRFLGSHQLMSVIIYGLAIGILAGALWFTYQHVQPLPPSSVTIASGGPGGSYYGHADMYADYFADKGYELNVLETKGSMNNLELLTDPESDVQAALMQGGIADSDAYPGLESLGSLYYEPVWAFHRKKLNFNTLADLKGLKIAIGAEGSGTNHLIRELLDENGITDDVATLIEAGAGTATPMLLDGKIDVLFTIAGVQSDAIRALIEADDKVLPYSFVRAEAYTRTQHYLQKLVLPRGSIDMINDLPRHDITLLAPTANLVIRDTLHPAIRYLFLLAATDEHGMGDVFAKPGLFPNGKALLFPLADEAANYYKSGPPFLMRYMPFQIAITVERLKILLIPLLTLLFPLFKITPPAYRWQIRRRIFKWYKHLKKLDTEAYEMTSPEGAKRMLAQLERLDRKVMETSVPLSYTDYIYSLRIHIRMIEERLKGFIDENEQA